MLSAKHGLLHFNEIIVPYDVTLAGLSANERYQWSLRVLKALDHNAGLESGDVVEVHAGLLYRDSRLVEGLLVRGVTVEVPAQGLGIGEQLRFYKSM